MRTIGGRLRCASASSKMANNGGLEEARNSVSRLCLAEKTIFASPKSIQGEDDLKDVIRALGKWLAPLPAEPLRACVLT